MQLTIGAKHTCKGSGIDEFVKKAEELYNDIPQGDDREGKIVDEDSKVKRRMKFSEFKLWFVFVLGSENFDNFVNSDERPDELNQVRSYRGDLAKEGETSEASEVTSKLSKERKGVLDRVEFYKTSLDYGNFEMHHYISRQAEQKLSLFNIPDSGLFKTVRQNFYGDKRSHLERLMKSVQKSLELEKKIREEDGEDSENEEEKNLRRELKRFKEMVKEENFKISVEGLEWQKKVENKMLKKGIEKVSQVDAEAEKSELLVKIKEVDNKRNKDLSDIEEKKRIAAVKKEKEAEEKRWDKEYAKEQADAKRKAQYLKRRALKRRAQEEAQKQKLQRKKVKTRQ